VPQPVRENVNILLVDDSLDSLVALAALLDGPDRTVIKAPSGEAALRYLLDEDVGVILLDVKLGGLDGYDTAARIRQRQRTRIVPIIFMTAYNKDDRDVVRGYGYGAVDYIFKPVVPDILRSKIDCFVELAKRTQCLLRANRELEQSERDWLRGPAAQGFVHSNPLPAFLADLRGRVLSLNPAASVLLGLTVGEPLEQGLSRVLTPGEAWQCQGAFLEVVERAVTGTVTVHPRLSSEGRGAFTLQTAPVRCDNGQVVGLVGVLVDAKPYEDALLRMERLKVELAQKSREFERHKEIVLSRDVALLSLEQEIKALKQQLNSRCKDRHDFAQ
jgi:DNA-binding response OmpR family regulator